MSTQMSMWCANTIMLWVWLFIRPTLYGSKSVGTLLYLNIFVCFFFVSILFFCILLFNLWFIVCDAISVLFWFLFCFCTFHDGLPMTIWLHWLVMCNSFLYGHGHWLGKIKNFLVVVVVQQVYANAEMSLFDTLQSSTFAIGLCLWRHCCDTKGIV